MKAWYFGAQSSSVVPLNSKNGSFLLRIMKCWAKHFTDHIYDPWAFNENFINNLPQKDIIPEMMDYPTVDEVQKTIKEINTEKELAAEIYHIISNLIGWFCSPELGWCYFDFIVQKIGYKSVC